ncbi:class I SAM-dependent methyltransferase [Nitrincola alkalilacustris]|uniref:class I SAM-dependent methyltransferase n=1 Tax=Nitrincola alkalilacustris TaxID=1571224 RepID=UPI001456B387|nr:class I SAM-dependent methyltransferase [Nitrincola alkalilacustris]
MPSSPSNINSHSSSESAHSCSAATTEQTVTHYHLHAERYQAQYDSIAAADVHADWKDLLDELSVGSALDVGAGSGRDAQWLADLGWEVTAVEPASKLREIAQNHTHAAIKWVDARLPDLVGVNAPGDGFDLILLSAIWMHVPQNYRPASFKRILDLLSPSGTVIITLRFGPSDPERPMYPVSLDELIVLAAKYGVSLVEFNTQHSSDKLQRADVTWTTVALARAVELGNE